MSGDRADRLRRRRQRARDRAQDDDSSESEATTDAGSDASEATDGRETSEETAEPAKTDKLSKMAGTDGTAETDRTGETDERTDADESAETPTASVKDEQTPTYMYLPHEVRRDLDRAYAMLKADYEYEFDESFEKNRHFYPLVVSLGLEAMADLDAEGVRDRLGDDE
jgi:hypothetical protein